MGHQGCGFKDMGAVKPPILIPGSAPGEGGREGRGKGGEGGGGGRWRKLHGRDGGRTRVLEGGIGGSMMQ